MNKTIPMIALALFVPLAQETRSQSADRAGTHEQSSFGSEEVPGEARIKHPIRLPDPVAEILRADDWVRSCLENNPLSPGETLSTWFLASPIHLAGSEETDLVVLPSLRREAALCFQGATGIGWFWVFRKTGDKYQLVLKAAGNSLDVLKNRDHVYRDIRTSTIGQAGKYLTTIVFRFDGERYREYQNRTKEQH